MARGVYINKYIEDGVLSLAGGNLIILPPQRGKTRQTTREFMSSARRGDTLIYGVSTHAEAISVVKHYVEYQRELGWELRCLLIVYAGLNRWCPLYRQIVKERKQLGQKYSQNKFCRQNCELWRMKPLQKEFFEPGRPARYIKNKHDKQNTPPIVHGPIRIIINKYDYRLATKLYKNLVLDDVKHHTMVVWDGPETKKYAEPWYYHGCPRALIMRKLIQVLDRDKEGKIKGQHRRSVYGYPTIIVVPQQLLPLVIHFATIYSARVYVVIDEFDRLLQSKVPTWFAERYISITQEQLSKNEWIQALTGMHESDKEEQRYTAAVPPLTTLKTKRVVVEKKGWMLKTRLIYEEIPLIILVNNELEKAKEKGKLDGLTIIGSSIPMLSWRIIETTIKWIKSVMGDITVYWSIQQTPDYTVTFNPAFLLQTLQHTLYVAGSKAEALNTVRQLLQNGWGTTIDLPTPLSDLTLIPALLCGEEAKGDYTYCVTKNHRHGYLIYPIIRGGKVVQLQVVQVKLKGRDYIKINTNYITWLGGRLTRGVKLPHNIKNMIIATRGSTEINGSVFYRLNDLLQVVFRINSRPDIKVYIADYSVPFVKQSIKWFNKHVAKIVQLINNM